MTIYSVNGSAVKWNGDWKMTQEFPTFYVQGWDKDAVYTEAYRILNLNGESEVHFEVTVTETNFGKPVEDAPLPNWEYELLNGHNRYVTHAIHSMTVKRLRSEGEKIKAIIALRDAFRDDSGETSLSLYDAKDAIEHPDFIAAVTEKYPDAVYHI